MVIPIIAKEDRVKIANRGNNLSAPTLIQTLVFPDSR